MSQNLITTCTTLLQGLNSRKLLFLLILPILLFACEKPEKIGYELQPQGEVEVFFTDSISIKSSTVLLDSLVTSNALVLTSGNYVDPVFGNVKTSSFLELRGSLEDNDIMFLQNKRSNQSFIPDSLVLELTVEDFYGDLSKNQTFKIYKLTENIDPNKNYFKSDEIPFENTELLSKTLEGSALKKGEVVSFKLDGGLMNEVFNAAKDSVTTNKTFVTNTLKGLAIVAEQDSWMMSYRVIGTETKPTKTALKLYYTEEYKDLSGVDQKINRVYFLTGTKGRFNHIESTSLSSDIASLTAAQEKPTTETNNLGYVQAGIGFSTKISFPYLKESLSKRGKIVINKAELVIKPKTKSNEALAVPDLILLYEANNSNQILKNSEGKDLVLQKEGFNPFGTDNPSIASYSNRTGEYRINITSHLQQIYTGKKKNEAMFIVPGFNNYSIRRAILDFDKSSNFSSKLRVYYTLFK